MFMIFLRQFSPETICIERCWLPLIRSIPSSWPPSIYTILKKCPKVIAAGYSSSCILPKRGNELSGVLEVAVDEWIGLWDPAYKLAISCIPDCVLLYNVQRATILGVVRAERGILLMASCCYFRSTRWGDRERVKFLDLNWMNVLIRYDMREIMYILNVLS